MEISDLITYGGSSALIEALASTGIKDLYPPQILALKGGLLMTPYRIALAVDQSAIRNGIMRVLSGIADLMVVGEASDGLDLLSFLNRLSPDLVILDSSMANIGEIEMVHEIKTISPTIKILILPNVTNKKDLLRTISVGADGYLHREDIETRISSAIETIWRGGTYISPTLLEELSKDWVQVCQESWKHSSEFLTMRENEILKFIAEGKSSKEIANLLFISPRTVEHHRSNIMNKLNVTKIAGLIKYAVCQGYPFARI